MYQEPTGRRPANHLAGPGAAARQLQRLIRPHASDSDKTLPARQYVSRKSDLLPDEREQKAVGRKKPRVLCRIEAGVIQRFTPYVTDSLTIPRARAAREHQGCTWVGVSGETTDIAR